jgi:hypothetical protein
MRVRDRRVADVGGDQDASNVIEREPVRLHTDPDLERVPLGARREHRNGVFASVGCKDKAHRLGHQSACHAREAGNRFNVPISRDVDHIDRIVAGVRDIEPIRRRVDVGMVEAALGSIFRKFDVT